MNEGRMISFVVGSGAIGGFMAWILQTSTGGRLLPWPWYGSVPAAMLLGGGAAGVGVFVLANTDIRHRGRALFFALLCGVSFKPVWQAGSNFVTGAVSQAQAQSQLSELQANTSRLNESVQSGSVEDLQRAVQETAGATSALLSQAEQVPDAELKERLQEGSVQAIDTIAAATSKAPEASLDSLYKIGIAARERNQTTLARHVIDSLNKIESSNPDPSVAKKAREAAADIQASDSVGR